MEVATDNNLNIPWKPTNNIYEVKNALKFNKSHGFIKKDHVYGGYFIVQSGKSQIEECTGGIHRTYNIKYLSFSVRVRH